MKNLKFFVAGAAAITIMALAFPGAAGALTNEEIFKEIQTLRRQVQLLEEQLPQEEGGGIGIESLAPSISVYAPFLEQVVVGKAGTSFNVQWVTQNWDPAALVNIDLVYPDGGRARLASSQPNNGLFRLAINADQTQTRNYRVRVSAAKESSLVAGEEGWSDWFTVTAPEQSLVVTAPAAGETILGKAGTSFAVQWTAGNWPSDTLLHIVLVAQSGGITTVGSYVPNNSAFTAAVPADAAESKNYRILIYDALAQTISARKEAYSGTFTIAAPPALPPLTVSISAAPNPVAWGTAPVIEWSSANAAYCGGTGFSTNGAVSGRAAGAAQTDNFTYTIICTNASGASGSGSVTVRVEAASLPSLAVTSPAAGQTVVGKAGTSYAVRWTTENWPSDARVDIFLVGDDGVRSHETLGRSLPNSGAFTATIKSNATLTKTYRVRISDAAAASQGNLKSGQDGYSGSFTITAPPSIAVTAPRSQQAIVGKAGTSYAVRWMTRNWPSDARVNIDLIGADWSATRVLSSIPNTGSASITFSEDATATAHSRRIRVSMAKEGALAAGEEGLSGNFTILAVPIAAPAAGSPSLPPPPSPSITVIAPAEGQTIIGKGGTSFNVQWMTQNWTQDALVGIDIVYPDGTMIRARMLPDPNVNGVVNTATVNINTDQTETKTLRARVYIDKQGGLAAGEEGLSGTFTIVPPPAEESSPTGQSDTAQRLANILESLSALLESMR